ncbi:MAG: hypothetical protein HYV09_08620 [Deltaproteobacteria bacterium]|nr:hypothetical protein [Deltaproteobacteria bacterium]
MKKAPPRWVACVLAAILCTAPRVAHALDKQGSAHGGALEGDDEGFGVSGALSSGVALYNPTFASRPDNSGRAFLRYAAHADVDVIGRRLSFPLDVNVFTDRTREGAGKAAPSELDLMGGVTSTWRVGATAVEIGSRFQHERPVDRGTFSQTFVDTRARLLYSVAELAPSLTDALGGGDISGWLTLGWFTINRTFLARPDNTGLAFLRYAANARVSFWQKRLSFAIDASMFTDRRSNAWLRPSELDLTPEIVVRAEPFEVHLAYERDMPVDRRGLVQHFVYLLAVWEFALFEPREPVEERSNIVSP